jgi:hypothetical protein
MQVTGDRVGRPLGDCVRIAPTYSTDNRRHSVHTQVIRRVKSVGWSRFVDAVSRRPCNTAQLS